MSYTTDEIDAALAVSEVAGGMAYRQSVHPSDADVEVSTADGLLDALASSADIIAVADDARIDLSGEDKTDIGSKTLVSWRGIGGRTGGLIYSDTRGYIGRRPHAMFDSDGDPHIVGLRLRGPRAGTSFTRWDYDSNLACGIRLRGVGGEIENCLIWGWPWNSIHVKGGSEDAVCHTEIHHSRFLDSTQIGYGYGIDIRHGFAGIHHCYFDNVRHAVDLYGFAHSGYRVEHSVFGPTLYSHPLDAHCLTENGRGVGDDPDHVEYDLRAGGRIEIRYNTVCTDTNSRGGPLNAVTIRGVPMEGVWIENNRFVHDNPPSRNSGNNQTGDVWRQPNLSLSSWDPVPTTDDGFTENFHARNNQFGAPETPWSEAYGAPVDLKDPQPPSDPWAYELLRRRLQARELRATTESLTAIRDVLN